MDKNRKSFKARLYNTGYPNVGLYIPAHIRKFFGLKPRMRVKIIIELLDEGEIS